ncbi:MAG: Clp protease N-terminal domain-containing protein [Planctomycetota bacterium]
MARSKPRAATSHTSPSAPSPSGDPLEWLAHKADEQAISLQASQVSTGHLLLAVLDDPTGSAVKLLADDGVEPALAATRVEQLSRMQEGGEKRDPLTARAADALARAYGMSKAAPASDRMLAAMLMDPDCVATHALEKLGVKREQLLARVARLVDGAAPAKSATPDASAASTPGSYRLTPAQYAVMAVDGDYQTAAQKKPFHLRVVYGDMHIYSGWRFQKKAYDGEGNSIFWEKERCIRECIEFVRRMGEVELGSCAENRVPGPDTFEAFLRQFSITGNLASYLPAVLEKLGAITIEKRAKGVHWAVPADRVGAGDTA